MKSALVTITGLSPYSQSRAHETPKLEKELADAYAVRTWKNHLHTNNEGKIVIPPNALMNSIKECAKYLSLQVPGKGKSTYTKHFDAGLMINEGIVLPLTADDVDFDRLYLDANGQVGGGKRVWRYYPRIDQWGGQFRAFLFDDIITLDVFTKVVKATGELIGIGRFRPRNRGYYGRFRVDSVQWFEEEQTMAALA